MGSTPLNGAQRATPSELQQCFSDADTWPIPGAGQTTLRWRLLADLGRRDLVLARLVEAHADALAICAELDVPFPETEQRWGVWAAGPKESLTAVTDETGWRLKGEKPWCSGATLLSHALVTATACDGYRLFAVDLDQESVVPCASDWVGPGMRGTDTRSVAFDHALARPVGEPGDYLERPGFWVGAIGVAACWLGGARRVAEGITRRAGSADVSALDPHLLTALGAIHVSLASAEALLDTAGRRVDADPRADHMVVANTVRAAVAAAADDVIVRAGRALGPGPLAMDAGHARTVSDLMVYVRQHHGDRDLAALGHALLDRDR